MLSTNMEIKINGNYDKRHRDNTKTFIHLKLMSFSFVILNLISLALYYKHQPESEVHLLLVGKR
jgi:hypothetical protein